jgi:hypothetical protein
MRTAAAVAASAALALGGLVAAAPAHSAIDDGLVLKYNLTEAAGTVAEDSSGNGRNGVISGDATSLGTEGLQLGGTNAHVRLPNDVMRGLGSITVSTDVKIAADQGAPYFIWGMGNTTNGTGNGYLFTTGNSYRTSIASGNWATEQTTSANRDLARGAWKTITYTLSGGTAVLYEDGTEVAGRPASPSRREALGEERRRRTTSGGPSTAATSTSRARSATSASTTGHSRPTRFASSATFPRSSGLPSTCRTCRWGTPPQ